MSLRELLEQPQSRTTQPCHGKIVRASRTTAYARLPHASLGDICTIAGDGATRAQIVAFNGDTVALAPFDHLHGIRVGAPVENLGTALSLNEQALAPGTILDAFGEPLDPNLSRRYGDRGGRRLNLFAPPPPALTRAPIHEILETGIRPIDALTPIGYGQRLGIFAPPGVGKSTLLGILAARAAVDITVVGLIGERGREVNEFIDDCLGEAGRQRTILVVSTGDETALRRATAPLTATRIAEYHRASGKRVLLLIDSLTRFARALRDLGFAAGEPPLAQGLTPSLYAELPRLLERAGTDRTGSITALYTVLSAEPVEGDVLAEEVKSLLDGHLVLSSPMRKLGYTPAIDPSRSVSRLASRLLSAAERDDAETLVTAIHRLVHDRDVVTFGGTPDPLLARALQYEEEIRSFMRHHRGSPSALADTRLQVARLARLLRGG